MPDLAMAHYIGQIVGGVVSLLCAGAVFWLGRGRPVARAFAMYAVAGSCTFLFGSGGTLLSARGLGVAPGAGEALRLIGNMWWATLPALYLMFLGLAAPSPLVRWAAGKLARRFLIAGAVAAAAAYWAADPHYPQLARVVAGVAVLVTGLMAAYSAFYVWQRAAPGSTARRRAGRYLTAFISHDVSLITFMGVIVVDGILQTEASRQVFYVGGIGMSAVFVFLFIPLVLRGIFAGRMLDIEIRARIVVGRTTLLAVVATLFVVITEAIEAAIGISDPIVAVPVAVGLFAAVQPLHRLAARFATKVVPVVDVGALDQSERLRMYNEQVELAHADGVVTSAEEKMLARLRERLGLAEQA